MPGPLDFTNQKLRFTYQRVVQYQLGVFYDGLGNVISTGFGSIIIAGENYITVVSNVITAHPINLASTNVTGRLPLSNLPQTLPYTLIGNPTTTFGNLTPITIGVGLQFVGNQIQIDSSFFGSSVFNETPSGTQDGVNNTFYTSKHFVANSTRVFLNGQRLKIGVSFDYIEFTSSGIQFTQIPSSTDNIIIDYNI